MSTPPPDPSAIAGALNRLDGTAQPRPYYNALRVSEANPGGFDGGGYMPPLGRDGMGNLFALADDVAGVGAWMTAWVPTVVASAGAAADRAAEVEEAVTTVEAAAAAVSATAATVADAGAAAEQVKAEIAGLRDQAAEHRDQARHWAGVAVAASTAGGSLRYALDGLGGDAVTLTYDERGRVARIDDVVFGAARVQTVTYDTAGNPETVTVSWDGHSRTTVHTWASGRLVGSISEES